MTLRQMDAIVYSARQVNRSSMADIAVATRFAVNGNPEVFDKFMDELGRDNDG